MDDRLERLEKIQDCIDYGLNKASNYKDSIVLFQRFGFNDLVEKNKKRAEDLLRGIERLRKLFNKELDNLKYREVQ